MGWLQDLAKQVEGQPNKQQANYFPLIVCSLSIVAAVYFYKTGNPIIIDPLMLPQVQQQVNPQVNPQLYNQPQFTPEQRIDRLEGACRKIWERTRWNTERLTLLATINNHNMLVIKNSLPRTELITLNADWSINRMPDRIYLDNQDREFLKQFVRPNQTSEPSAQKAIHEKEEVK